MRGNGDAPGARLRLELQRAGRDESIEGVGHLFDLLDPSVSDDDGDNGGIRAGGARRASGAWQAESPDRAR